MVSSIGTTGTHAYSIVLAKGSCSRPDAAGIALDHRGEAGFAQLGTSHVAIPLHALVKDGYILVLHDLTEKRAVACGAIHSDAVW